MQLVRFDSAAEPGTDRPHRPAGASAHEEWTLLATDDRGEAAFTARFHFGIPFRKRTASDPLGVFSFGLFREGRLLARFLERHPADALSAEGPLLRLRIGENTLTGGRDHNLTLFELHLDEPRPGTGTRLRGEILFQLPYHERERPVPAAPPARPVVGRDEEVLSLLAPDAIVRGDLAVEDRSGAARHRLAFHGRGSVDHAAGVTNLGHALVHAIRVSAHDGEFSCFCFHAAPSGSAEKGTYVVLAERDRPLLVFRDASPVPGKAARSSNALPKTLDWTASEGAATIRFRCALDRISERGPHFLRFRPAVEVEARTREGDRVAFGARGIAEAIVPPRRIGSSVTTTRLKAVR